MAFNADEFTFAGKSSLMYGLMLYNIDGKGQSDVSFGNKGVIIETRTDRRIQPLHFGVNYNKTPLQFKLVFGSENPLDRYDLERISMWLTGYQSYQWLSINQPDLENVQFRCLITQLTPISVGWLNYAFEAMVVCDCPYAYSHPFEKQYTISGETKILFRNKSSVREFIKPKIVFSPSERTTSLSITNADDNNRQFLLKNIPEASNVVIDNNNGIITETNYGSNLYSGFNTNFLRFVSGDNNLTVVGDGLLTISGRFLHNVGA